MRSRHARTNVHAQPVSPPLHRNTVTSGIKNTDGSQESSYLEEYSSCPSKYHADNLTKLMQSKYERLNQISTHSRVVENVRMTSQQSSRRRHESASRERAHPERQSSKDRANARHRSTHSSGRTEESRKDRTHAHRSKKSESRIVPVARDSPSPPSPDRHSRTHQLQPTGRKCDLPPPCIETPLAKSHRRRVKSAGDGRSPKFGPKMDMRELKKILTITREYSAACQKPTQRKFDSVKHCAVDKKPLWCQLAKHQHSETHLLKHETSPSRDRQRHSRHRSDHERQSYRKQKSENKKPQAPHEDSTKKEGRSHRRTKSESSTQDFDFVNNLSDEDWDMDTAYAVVGKRRYTEVRRVRTRHRQKSHLQQHQTRVENGNRGDESSEDEQTHSRNHEQETYYNETRNISSHHEMEGSLGDHFEEEKREHLRGSQCFDQDDAPYPDAPPFSCASEEVQPEELACDSPFSYESTEAGEKEFSAAPPSSYQSTEVDEGECPRTPSFPFKCNDLENGQSDCSSTDQSNVSLSMFLLQNNRMSLTQRDMVPKQLSDRTILSKDLDVFDVGSEMMEGSDVGTVGDHDTIDDTVADINTVVEDETVDETPERRSGSSAGDFGGSDVGSGDPLEHRALSFEPDGEESVDRRTRFLQSRLMALSVGKSDREKRDKCSTIFDPFLQDNLTHEDDGTVGRLSTVSRPLSLDSTVVDGYCDRGVTPAHRRRASQSSSFSQDMTANCSSMAETVMDRWDHSTPSLGAETSRNEEEDVLNRSCIPAFISSPVPLKPDPNSEVPTKVTSSKAPESVTSDDPCSDTETNTYSDSDCSQTKNSADFDSKSVASSTQRSIFLQEPTSNMTLSDVEPVTRTTISILHTVHELRRKHAAQSSKLTSLCDKIRLAQFRAGQARTIAAARVSELELMLSNTECQRRQGLAHANALRCNTFAAVSSLAQNLEDAPSLLLESGRDELEEECIWEVNSQIQSMADMARGLQQDAANMVEARRMLRAGDVNVAGLLQQATLIGVETVESTVEPLEALVWTTLPHPIAFAGYIQESSEGGVAERIRLVERRARLRQPSRVGSTNTASSNVKQYMEKLCLLACTNAYVGKCVLQGYQEETRSLRKTKREKDDKLLDVLEGIERCYQGEEVLSRLLLLHRKAVDTDKKSQTPLNQYGLPLLQSTEEECVAGQGKERDVIKNPLSNETDAPSRGLDHFMGWVGADDGSQDGGISIPSQICFADSDSEELPSCVFVPAA